jgi:two-component system, NarL family, nitrate/nitrite response regulator NarL
MSESVRVLVVDDDAFTQTLVATLVENLGHSVCARTGTVAEAMALAGDLRPDAAVLDLDLGEGPTGLDLAHGLRRLLPRIAIVMLSSYGDPTWMGQRREPPLGLRYVVKGDVSDVHVLGDTLALALAEPLADDLPSPAPAPLNEGQWEILRLVAGGYTNGEIARRRSLTEDAVNKAITRLVRQLGIDAGPDGNARVLLAKSYHRMTGTVSERRN